MPWQGFSTPFCNPSKLGKNSKNSPDYSLLKSCCNLLYFSANVPISKKFGHFWAVTSLQQKGDDTPIF